MPTVQPRDDYHATELRRLAKRSRDNRQIDPNITSKFDLPSLLNNAFGLLPNDREWQFKTFGSYVWNNGLTAGFNTFFLTGAPISKLGAHRIYGLDERFVIFTSQRHDHAKERADHEMHRNQQNNDGPQAQAGRTLPARVRAPPGRNAAPL